MNDTSIIERKSEAAMYQSLVITLFRLLQTFRTENGRNPVCIRLHEADLQKFRIARTNNQGRYVERLEGVAIYLDPKATEGTYILE